MQSYFEIIKKDWDEILIKMCKEYDISSISYDTFLKLLKPLKMVDDVVFIEILDLGEQGREIIEKKFSLSLKVSIGEHIKYPCSIVFVLPEEKEDEPEHVESKAPINTKITEEDSYTFENFLEGATNKYAYNAAVAVADSPGIFNPLFIHSKAGLGKTHLMHAIKNHINKTRPEMEVLYVTSEDFTNEIITAIRSKSDSQTLIENFKEKYRKTDVLLVDDIQFIFDKQRSQEEFFHTFNSLYELKKQIVISCDKPPIELSNVEDRLVSRFNSGLTASIDEPDFETKAAILRKKAEENNFIVKDEIINYIAAKEIKNIRQLNGALNKIMHYTLLEPDEELTIEIVERELKDIISPGNKEEITAEYITRLVCNQFNISEDLLMSNLRTSDVALARHVSIYLCRTCSGLTQKETGDYFNKDHSTIINSEKAVKKKMLNDKEFKKTIDVLIKLLKN